MNPNKLLMVLCLVALAIGIARASDFSEYSNDQIVQAIWRAEGGNKTNFPYGIKSLKYEDRTDRNLTKEEWARKICLNSVRNGRARWEAAGKPDDLIVFIGRRFCPVGAPDDPRNLNSNWVRNVKHFLIKGKW